MAPACASNLRALAIPLFVLILAPGLATSQEDPIAAARTRLSEADSALHSGNLYAAQAAYRDVLAQFPTWWIPVLKSTVASIAMRAPAAQIDQALARVRTLEPTGDYLALISLLLALERDTPDPAADLLPLPPDTGSDTVRVPLDTLSRRLAMARGLAFERSGRVGAAILEYRNLLARDPEVQAARFRLAQLLRQTGRPEEASALMREGQARSLYPARWRAGGGPMGAPIRGNPAN